MGTYNYPRGFVILSDSFPDSETSLYDHYEGRGYVDRGNTGKYTHLSTTLLSSIPPKIDRRTGSVTQTETTCSIPDKKTLQVAVVRQVPIGELLLQQIRSKILIGYRFDSRRTILDRLFIILRATILPQRGLLVNEITSFGWLSTASSNFSCLSTRIDMHINRLWCCGYRRLRALTFSSIKTSSLWGSWKYSGTVHPLHDY